LVVRRASHDFAATVPDEVGALEMMLITISICDALVSAKTGVGLMMLVEMNWPWGSLLAIDQDTGFLVRNTGGASPLIDAGIFVKLPTACHPQFKKIWMPTQGFLKVLLGHESYVCRRSYVGEYNTK
jgi:hypothetical protein